MNLSPLCAQLGYTFRSISWLEAALVHRSYVHERPKSSYPSNERLEFLGDALLNFITGLFLYHTYPERGEGELTMARAALVNTQTLARFARSYNLGAYVLISKGEERSGARERDSLLADTFEALLAAISLDGGWEATQAFVVPLLKTEMERLSITGQLLDFKSALQERVQAQIGQTPVYRKVSVTGPDHRRQWTMEVWVGEILLGRGKGRSKQVATQQAAQSALAALDSANSPLPAATEVNR